MRQQEVQKLEQNRTALLQDQLTRAQEFYALDQTVRNIGVHRRVTEEMTKNALDLVLPQVVQNIEQEGLRDIALVAPLRGGLALVTPYVIQHLRNRLWTMRVDATISLWALGIKRHPETNSTDVYFRGGYDTGGNNRHSHALIMDWGTATGLTNDQVAHELRNVGVWFQNMTAVSMTITKEGEERLLTNCKDETGQIGISASTRASMNEIKYIDTLYHAEGGEAHSVNPKDWGDCMFGSWALKHDDDHRRVSDLIEGFSNEFRNTFKFSTSPAQARSLKTYYRQTYLGTPE